MSDYNVNSVEEIGLVLSNIDGTIGVVGLDAAILYELLELEITTALVFNIEAFILYATILGNDSDVFEGELVTRAYTDPQILGGTYILNDV